MWEIKKARLAVRGRWELVLPANVQGVTRRSDHHYIFRAYRRTQRLHRLDSSAVLSPNK